MTERVAGYLVWNRGQDGKPTAQKVDAGIYEGRQPETRKLHAQRELWVYKLGEADWGLDLDALMAKYIAPKTE